MKTALLFVTLSALLLTSSSGAASEPALDDTERLHELFAREWQWRLRESPLFATAVGVHDFNDRLSDESLAAQARRTEETRAFLAELATIPRAALPRDEQVNHDIFRAQLDLRVRSFEFGEHLMPFNADSGFHSGFADLPDTVPLANARDYENYLARLAAFPRYMDDHLELLREGLRRGMTVPRVTLNGIETTIVPHVVEDAERSVFWAPFAKPPATMAAAERERLKAAARRAIMESIVPAYRKFLDFMTREYLPGARTTLAASALPNGEAYYRYLIRNYTTLDLSADEIHQTGLREVESIRKEMDAVIAGTGFQGDFAAFLEFLRTDPRFYAKTPEELLKQAAWIAKRMDGKLPSLFRTLPRLPYTVEPVPDHLAPKYTAGRYFGAPHGSTQPGIYWVNTYALEKRPLYNLDALTFHEAVPGHHLQNALADEAESLPDFRRFSYLSAFGEGWGLYSEWLGLEAGFYQDPYTNFGRLTYAMWRACRLVVDTGLHAQGWTRERAIEYMATRTALPLHEVETETDRYISWPGQALSYKIGEMKIRELRRRAETALGAKFDVRDFHDAVLRNGAVPLPVLEEEIDRFVAGTRE